jgi:hypothetical protein
MMTILMGQECLWGLSEGVSSKGRGQERILRVKRVVIRYIMKTA